MDNTFKEDERLYRAVYPPSHPGMFWKKDGTLSPSAFADPKGLSVERGYYRAAEQIVEKMKKTFSGCIVSVSVGDCINTEAKVRYLPSKDNTYHSEIHKSEEQKLLDRKQRLDLARAAQKEYMEE